MTRPIRFLIRKLSIALHRSRKETHIMPLRNIRNAVVLLDWKAPDCAKTAELAKEFFGRRSIGVFIIDASGRNSFNIFGRLRRRVRIPAKGKGKRAENLFISLVTEACYAEEYEARCSRAVFKIGRNKFSKPVYDMELGRGRKPYSQVEAFLAIKDYLEKVV